jgi:hypothetical protein
MDLCDYLTAKVLEPRFEQQGHKWDRRFMDFFTFDNACDPLEPTGTIYFTIPPLFAGQVGELQNAIERELWRCGIKTGTFTATTRADVPTAKVLQIPIVENPTASTEPPEVNVSQTRGCLVLRDLLGYERVQGRYEFTADELLDRAGRITEDKIAACVASPVRDTKVPEGVARVSSPSSINSIRRCLLEIQQFAQWALSRNYRRLAAI